jgi:hypothetical protein
MPPLLKSGISAGPSFPNALTTGWAAGGYSGLTPVTISTPTDIPATGAPPSWCVGPSGGPFTVTGIAFTIEAQIQVYADEVTFIGCDFNSTGAAYSTGPNIIQLYGTGPYVVDWCNLYGAGGAATRVSEIIFQDNDTNLTVQNCNCYGFKQVVNMTDNTTLGQTIINNYFHDLAYFSGGGGDHSEPIYAGANGTGNNITITGNTLLNNLTQTAAIYLHTTENFTNTVISNNFFAGGSYTLYCGGSGSTDVVIEDNVFSTAYFPGCGSAANPAVAYPSVSPPFNVSGGNVWAGNTWYDGPLAGQLIAAP